MGRGGVRVTIVGWVMVEGRIREKRMGRMSNRKGGQMGSNAGKEKRKRQKREQ